MREQLEQELTEAKGIASMARRRLSAVEARVALCRENGNQAPLLLLKEMGEEHSNVNLAIRVVNAALDRLTKFEARSEASAIANIVHSLDAPNRAPARKPASL